MNDTLRTLGAMVAIMAASVVVGVPIQLAIRTGIDSYLQWRYDSEPVVIESEDTSDSVFRRTDDMLSCVVCRRSFPSPSGDSQTERTFCYACRHRAWAKVP